MPRRATRYSLRKGVPRSTLKVPFLHPLSEFLINRVRSALTKASQARSSARHSAATDTSPVEEVGMLELLTLGSIAAWAFLLLLFLLAHAPQRTMTEIIRDIESSR